MNAAGPLRRARAGLPGLIVLVALAAGLAALVIVAAGGHPPASQAQQVQQIAAGLHCPICKDLSVADSPAPLAQQMRQEIARKLRAGESADQIRARFVAAYGDSVLMSPPRQGVAGAVYYLPWLILAAGLITAFVLLRRWLRAPPPGPLQTSPQQASPQTGPPQTGPPQAGPPRASPRTGPPQAGPPQAGPPRASPRTGPPQADPPQLSAAQRRAVARALARLRAEEPG